MRPTGETSCVRRPNEHYDIFWEQTFHVAPSFIHALETLQAQLFRRTVVVIDLNNFQFNICPSIMKETLLDMMNMKDEYVFVFVGEWGTEFAKSSLEKRLERWKEEQVYPRAVFFSSNSYVFSNMYEHIRPIESVDEIAYIVEHSHSSNLFMMTCMNMSADDAIRCVQWPARSVLVTGDTELFFNPNFAFIVSPMQHLLRWRCMNVHCILEAVVPRGIAYECAMVAAKLCSPDTDLDAYVDDPLEKRQIRDLCAVSRFCVGPVLRVLHVPPHLFDQMFRRRRPVLLQRGDDALHASMSAQYFLLRSPTPRISQYLRLACAHFFRTATIRDPPPFVDLYDSPTTFVRQEIKRVAHVPRAITSFDATVISSMVEHIGTHIDPAYRAGPELVQLVVSIASIVKSALALHHGEHAARVKSTIDTLVLKHIPLWGKGRWDRYSLCDRIALRFE
jgi:hypothetical protein